MPVFSEAARNIILDATIGNDTPPTGIPPTYWLALFSADPSLADTPVDVELTYNTGGYQRLQVNNNSSVWQAASNAEKRTFVTLSIGPSTGAWSETVTHAGLMDTDGTDVANFPGELWDYTQLASPVTVASSGLTITFLAGTLVIRHL